MFVFFIVCSFLFVVLICVVMVKLYLVSFKIEMIDVNGIWIYVCVGGYGLVVVMLYGYGEIGDMW